MKRNVKSSKATKSRRKGAGGAASGGGDAQPSIRRRGDAQASAARLLLQSGELIVRMYRHGLGDCFLLALGTETGPRYVLIDCGVHMRQAAGTDRLAQVLRDVAAATGNRIHVVVATHEHADHLSGFVQKGSPFLTDALEIEEVWLAWTEKIGDAQADRLRKQRGAARQQIEDAVAEARRRAGPGMVGVANHLLALTEFERTPDESVDVGYLDGAIRELCARSPGKRYILEYLDPRPDVGAAAAARKKPSVNELALGLLMAKAERTRFCEPGTQLSLRGAGATGIRAYVLGPPRNEDLLKKDLPTKVRGGSSDHEGEGAYQEVYLRGPRASGTMDLGPALGRARRGGGGAEDESDDMRYPFGSERGHKCRLSRTRSEAGGRLRSPPAARKFFEEHYFAGDASWRRIDGDWLQAGERVALDLDSDTNNTSLVLAFELGRAGEGRVLLFPGDAQVGNWLSWRDQPYKADGKRMTADDLLSRTVLYKVGHHGSHNATAKRDPRRGDGSAGSGSPFGLELMENIIAMIPVDRAAAEREMPNPWRMPHLPLYVRLRERAQRRVLRSDSSLAPLRAGTDDPDLKPETSRWSDVPGLSDVQWRRSKETFEKGTEGPLCYDVLFQLGS